MESKGLGAETGLQHPYRAPLPGSWAGGGTPRSLSTLPVTERVQLMQNACAHSVGKRLIFAC